MHGTSTGFLNVDENQLVAIGDKHSCCPNLSLEELSYALSVLCTGKIFQPPLVLDRWRAGWRGLSRTSLAAKIVAPACLLPGQRAIWYIRDGSCAVGRPAWDAGKIEWFRAPRTDAGETADAELRAARGGGCGRKGEGILQAGGRDHPWWGV